MAHFSIFNPPGNNPDFAGDPDIARDWSLQDVEFVRHGQIASVTAYLANHGGGVCQFYNPVTHGRAEADLPAAATDIPWNGFPPGHGSPGPGVPPNYAAAEQPLSRPEKIATRTNIWSGSSIAKTGRSSRLISRARPTTISSFSVTRRQTRCSRCITLISPQVQMTDLFNGRQYDKLNKWNTEPGRCI